MSPAPARRSSRRPQFGLGSFPPYQSHCCLSSLNCTFTASPDRPRLVESTLPTPAYVREKPEMRQQQRSKSEVRHRDRRTSALRTRDRDPGPTQKLKNIERHCPACFRPQNTTHKRISNEKRPYALMRRRMKKTMNKSNRCMDTRAYRASIYARRGLRLGCDG